MFHSQLTIQFNYLYFYICIEQLPFDSSMLTKIFKPFLPNLKLTNSTNGFSYFSEQTKKPTFKTLSQLECQKLIQQENPLRETILQHINQFGQMKMDKYWKLALTDSQHGYYSKQNVFAKQGDFITSPQISSLFGQMIAIWIKQFLIKIGVADDDKVDKKFRIIQFGPGRGMLMRDLIKSLHQLKIQDKFDIYMVQVSQYNRKCQQENVQDQFKKYDKFFKYQFQNQTKQVEVFTNEDQLSNMKLKWFQNFQLIVKEDTDKLKNNQQLPITLFVMNQFFDALPTQVLQYTESGWRQRVFTKSAMDNMFFDVKVSQKQIPEKMRPLINDPKIGQTIQVSHESLIMIDTMSKLLRRTGGAILNIDYGQESIFMNSIRAIRQHKFVPSPQFWQIPGKCDLSAYVNFGALAHFAQMTQGIKAFQVLPQGYFLQAMGINPRIQILQKNMTKQSKQKMQSEYERLVHPDQMGAIFKVQLITLKQYGQIYPWISESQGVY